MCWTFFFLNKVFISFFAKNGCGYFFNFRQIEASLCLKVNLAGMFLMDISSRNCKLVLKKLYWYLDQVPNLFMVYNPISSFAVIGSLISSYIFKFTKKFYNFYQ